jgi:hypothetical protein
MKFLPVSLALLGGLLPLPGQEKAEPQLDVETPDSSEEEGYSKQALVDLPDGIAADASLGKRTFIPHALKVQPFTPPPPPVVKRLPAVRVDAAVAHLSKNSRTLTLHRGEASTEPDLPPPPPAPPYVAPQEPTPEEIAQRIWQQRHDLNLGATIYDHRISVVNWTDQETLVRYEAVCGFDIGLLAGVGGFIHDGEDYGLFLMHSDFDTTWERRLTKDWQLEVPEVAPGEILITRGDMKDTAATERMTVVKEIIATEAPRLIAYQAARATYFAASAAWHAAHPPIPRDETFILRPHRGSRYLPSAKSTGSARQ